MTENTMKTRARRRGHRLRLIGVAVGVAVAVGTPALGAQAATVTAPTQQSAALDAPPQDDPQAVAEYMTLLAEYRAAHPQTRSANAVVAAGPCLSSASVYPVSQGTTVSVWRQSNAPLIVCTNAAQAVYDNEYKALVPATAYQGQKWRDQLVCHIENAWNKTPWNLDSWRPDVGYAATVAALCNP